MNLTSRLERIERLWLKVCPATTDSYTDEEKAEIANLLREIHGSEYSNMTGLETFKYPDGLVKFSNGEVLYDQTGELFPSLQAAQKKYPGKEIIPADASIVEKLFAALRKAAK